MKVIGHIRTDFPSKFGIPRQSGLIDGLKGKIVLEPEYRNPQVYKGIEEFSHIWLLWEFSEAKKEHWSATVKPPRLGGKKRMGVFATRAPFRPNNIGLSCVKLDRVLGILAQDPRPTYFQDPERVYGVPFAGFDVKFRVDGDLLIVCGLEKG